ncbi:MAG: alcohol dehydrogenase catalytic domain-containing protein [Acidimicrobiales bacterium]|nr:alcohol dehydrogenase catalytic domain-containing protein [Acidimicrobiales bacterium]MCB9393567.1 alcohol dehydrogenase catalytic domain-containing protein [Acidimicrobiaceae bacterium]
MKALVWHGRRDVRVERVDDPRIEAPTDAVIRVTSSGLCGSDLHLYEVLAPFMVPGDVLGHEPMGIVEAVGSAVTRISPGDRVVVPFNISCGHCFMCDHGLQSQCETTQAVDHGTGAALFGYTKLYGQVPGGQAEYLRVPHADYGPIVVPDGPADDRFVYLSDVLPTAWQAVEYARPLEGPFRSLVVLGLGPIGDMSARVAQHRGVERVIGVDLVPERISRARAHGVEVIDLRESKGEDLTERVLALTSGRGADAVVDAVGMEAHGSPVAHTAHRLTALMPNVIAEQVMQRAGVDRLAALHSAIDLVRRGGTISLAGVYGGMADPMPMLTMFDKQVTLRMGQANVRRWVDDLLPLVLERDVLGVDDFATHRVPLDRGPEAYAMFQRKEHGAVKVLFDMAAGGGADGPREAATSITPDSMDDADVTNGEAGVLSGRAT